MMRSLTFLMCLCVLATSALASSGGHGGGGGNRGGSGLLEMGQPVERAIVSTTKVTPQELALSREKLYAQAILQLLANPGVADLGRCTGNEGWFSAPCIPPVSEAAAKKQLDDIATSPATVKKRYALLIANQDYRAPIPALETPKKDAEEIARVLQSEYGYEVTTLKDASKRDIVKGLVKLAGTASAADSVVVLYAGHGYLVAKTGLGYWIPTDATPTAAEGWISNSDITKLLAAVPARQLILISDSCYSGSLTKEKNLADLSHVKRDALLKNRTVTAMSSGGNEPVSDEGKDGHSIFAWSLINTLKSGNTGAIGTSVWRKVRAEVTKAYPQQPQYGALPSAGHIEGGDYLFFSAKP